MRLVELPVSANGYNVFLGVFWTRFEAFGGSSESDEFNTSEGVIETIVFGSVVVNLRLSSGVAVNDELGSHVIHLYGVEEATIYAESNSLPLHYNW